ncbi:heat shock cognate 71 kDa protein-like [Lepeophtheirus salmonis]|nr:heat shock 70 kDa protein-like [Lepeophtheirus salmonis]
MTQNNHNLGKFDLTGIPPAPRGTPQIEVTFDVDANGILNVSALDKSSGKEEKITIRNDKGRLSKEEIDKMIYDAEEYKAEDEKQKERIEAKNSLESYCFNLKSTVEKDEFKGKLSQEDIETVKAKCEETIKWLDTNQTAEKDEYQYKQKEIEALSNPIMKKLYESSSNSSSQRTSGCSTPGGIPKRENMGPTVEEVY